jgi:hypothetical protein
LEGNWIEKDGSTFEVKGKTLITWKDEWFTMATKLLFEESRRVDTTITYKGRLDPDEKKFSFVMQHNVMSKIEGEGWITPQAIIERYWVMDDKQMRTGFQTIYRRDDDCYHLCSAVTAGSSLISSMDALLTRL